MIGCVDVHYEDNNAIGACLVFESWESEKIIEERISQNPIASDYIPGSLYLRELPPILDVLKMVKSTLEIVIIDGNVWLDDKGQKGLGAKLHEQIKLPVIGVAKSFYNRGECIQPINRGKSTKPLFISAVGIEIDKAADLISAMQGDYRIPTILKRTDSLCRGQ